MDKQDLSFAHVVLSILDHYFESFGLVFKQVLIGIKSLGCFELIRGGHCFCEFEVVFAK